MAKSRSSRPVTPPHSSRETTEAERSSKLGAPGEPAGDVDAVLADHIDDEAEVRKRAHTIWDAEGRPDGRALDHWLRARSDHAKKP